MVSATGSHVLGRLLAVCFAGINLVGLLMAIPILIFAAGAFMDPISLMDAVVRVFGMLLFLACSIAGLASERKPWLGAAGLSILVSIFVLLSYLDLGTWTPDERAAYTAVQSGDAEGLRVALAHGVDPNSYDYDRGYLLTAAVLSNNPVVVKVLIDAGADVNIRNGKASTPLLKAVYLYKCEAARLLLDAGASLDDRFFDYANYTDLPMYYEKNVAEIYRGKKSERPERWKQDAACWLKFEQRMKNPPRPAWTMRRIYQKLVLMFA